MTRASRGSTYTELTTTRIYRLLRPLRAQCAKFAEEYKAYNRRVTHSTVNAPEHDQHPPLTDLLPAERNGLRVHCDKDSVRMMELSTKMYAIRDCFKNMVVNTRSSDLVEVSAIAASTRHSNASLHSPLRIKNASRVMSLMDICATVVGVNIEAEKEVEEKAEVGEELGAMAELYDSVPAACRRITMLNHAIDIILSTAPRHSTLMSILLNVCLSYSLAHQARTILIALLRYATRPQPQLHPPIPISHDEHMFYFSELCDRWRLGGQNEECFCEAVLEVLEEESSMELWTSKAIGKLGLLFQLIDSSALFRLQRCMLRFMWTVQGESCEHLVSEHLTRWVVTFVKKSVSSDSVWTVELGDYVAVTITEALCNSSSWSRLTDEVTLSFKNVLVCLATEWLSACRSQTGANLVTEAVHELSKLSPRPTTFSFLLDLVQERVTSLCLTDADAFHRCLKQRASALCSIGLLQLEACLWGCTLRFIEDAGGNPRFLRWVSQDQKKIYHRKLIDIVDDVENRCFGQKSPARAVTIHGPMAVAAPRGWQWEASMDAWVPVPTPYKPIFRLRPKAGQSNIQISPQPAEQKGLRRRSANETKVNARFTTGIVDSVRNGPSHLKLQRGERPQNRLNTRPPEAQMLQPVKRRERRRHSNYNNPIKNIPLSSTNVESSGVSSCPLKIVQINRNRTKRKSDGPTNFSSLLSDAISSRTTLRSKENRPTPLSLSYPASASPITPQKQPAIRGHNAHNQLPPKLIMSPIEITSSPLSAYHMSFYAPRPPDDLDLFAFNNISP